MMRRVQFAIAIAIVSIFAVFAVLRIETVHAQAQYEVSCAAGTNPLPTWNTFNPVTGLFHANGCVDPSGNLSSPVLGAGLQSKTITITAAQIDAMTNTTATSQTVLPTLPAGQMYEILFVSTNFHGGGAFATGTQGMILGVDAGGLVNGVWDPQGQAICTNGTLTGGSSVYGSSATAQPGGGGGIPIGQLTTKAILVNINATPQYTGGGTSTLTVTVIYRTISVT
jgi:hypothetical protein